MSLKRNIAVLDPSEIIFSGLKQIISASAQVSGFDHLRSVTDLERLLVRKNLSALIVNPAFVEHNQKYFTGLRNSEQSLRFAAIVSTFISPDTVAFFDEVIYVTDSSERVSAVVSRMLNSGEARRSGEDGDLSARELDVLRLLVTGLSNKQIADELNISINTVITHRKNITRKTGIRSVPGLTIFAVSKKIITLDLEAD